MLSVWRRSHPFSSSRADQRQHRVSGDGTSGGKDSPHLGYGGLALVPNECMTSHWASDGRAAGWSECGIMGSVSYLCRHLTHLCSFRQGAGSRFLALSGRCNGYRRPGGGAWQRHDAPAGQGLGFGR